jgi:RNA polymerase sigma factor (sigma-70 family)
LQVDSKYTGTYSDIKANDESALAALYTYNYPKVEAYVIRNSGTADQARDVYQEAFITVWQHIQSNRFREQDTGSIHGYLYQVAKNKWLDYLRSSRFKKTAPLPDVMREEDLPGNTTDNETYEARMQEEEKLQKTISAFGSLSDECRDMLRRFYFEKRSLRTIARAISINEASARNKKYRCMQKLREIVNTA